MATKGSSGSRRWIQHRPIDRRPIVGMYDTPRWLQLLERIAPEACMIIAIVTLAIAAYAFGVDYLAGHL